MTQEPDSNFIEPAEDQAFDWDDRAPAEPADDRWDAFLADDDQLDPLPEPGDFWIDSDGHFDESAGCQEPLCAN
ncbi:MAG: hypothetical protein KDA57_03995 [Planctomycetales bacterium]|nr:hypothetical protein [Planctomycetales bacterium]